MNNPGLQYWSEDEAYRYGYSQTFHSDHPPAEATFSRGAEVCVVTAYRMGRQDGLGDREQKRQEGIEAMGNATYTITDSRGNTRIVNAIWVHKTSRDGWTAYSLDPSVRWNVGDTFTVRVDDQS